MIVKRIVRTLEGEIEATLMLTPEQAAFLMNMGLGVLVQKGVATVMDYTEEEFRAEADKKQAEIGAESGGSSLVPRGQATTLNDERPTQPQPATTVTTQQQKDFLDSVDIELLHKA